MCNQHFFFKTLADAFCCIPTTVVQKLDIRYHKVAALGCGVPSHRPLRNAGRTGLQCGQRRAEWPFRTNELPNAINLRCTRSVGLWPGPPGGHLDVRAGHRAGQRRPFVPGGAPGESSPSWPCPSVGCFWSADGARASPAPRLWGLRQMGPMRLCGRKPSESKEAPYQWRPPPPRMVPPGRKPRSSPIWLQCNARMWMTLATGSHLIPTLYSGCSEL